MTGGRQLKSRREVLSSLVGEKIKVRVISRNWRGEIYSLEGILEFRQPDKGYFLKNTNAQIFLPYVTDINTDEKRVFMNLSKSLIQSPRIYAEVNL